MKKEKVKKIRKIVFFILLVVFIAIIIKLLPLFMELSKVEGRQNFADNITNLGIVGALQILMLEICKAVVVFLPAEPIELLSGMCFGPFVGTAIIYVGVIISTVTIYLAVKKYGLALVEDIVPEEKFKKISEIIRNNSEKVEVILFVLYFLPLVPKDFLTYIGSLLPINLKKFLFITLFARFPAIVSSTVVGDRILEGDLKTIIFAYAITYIISISFAVIYNKNFKKSKIEQRKREETIKIQDEKN